MLTLLLVLAFMSLIAAGVAALGKCPVWVPVIFIAIVECVHAFYAYGLK